MKKINFTRLKRKIILTFRFRRLKIVEESLIVLLIAVLVPLTIGGFVISNINQHVVRAQLKENAGLIAEMVSTEIDFFTSYEEEIAEKNGVETTTVTDLKYLNDKLFKSIEQNKRQIYIIDNKNEIIASHNFDKETFNQAVAQLPKALIKYEVPTAYGKTKNEPLIYLKKKSPEVTIIVNTPKTLTDATINKSRLKIISMILFAAFFILALGGLHAYYLYINIKQLFKGIMAVTKGNYKRQIRLLKSAFTPYEIVFLASEFNQMAHEINKTYIQLDKNNKELNTMNEFQKNLIDTVSHELRTPLTSIQGYTSRLLRQDIVIDAETQIKSLKVIREQTERLSRMIEDLLTVPDIDHFRLKTHVDKVWLHEIIEDALLLIKSKDKNEIVINMSEDFPQVYADRERLIQVFTNLLENAVKYSVPDSEILVEGLVQDNIPVINVRNKCDKIPEEKLSKLFEKFVRLDDNTTRTTRGTGLGLFIVKALVEAMNGEIKALSDDEWGFTAQIKFKPVEE